MDVDLDGCIRGDKQAWDAFVDRCSGVIYAAARRTIGSRPGGGESVELDDTVQDVYIRLVKDDCRLLRSYDPSRAGLSTWLTLVTRSVAIDRLRKRRLDTVPIDPRLDGQMPGNAPGAGREFPETPLHVLSPRQRLVLTMLFDRDMTVIEAAAALEVDEQTVRSTKHKALSRLRQAMAAGPGPPA
jgi:RNA polymerase sigma-70 factor (ECF subfamily)